MKLPKMSIIFFKLGRLQLPGGGSKLVGYFPGWKSSGWELYFVGISRVAIVRVGVMLNGNYSGCEFSLMGVFRVGIVRWESSRNQPNELLFGFRIVIQIV